MVDLQMEHSLPDPDLAVIAKLSPRTLSCRLVAEIVNRRYYGLSNTITSFSAQ